jgi:ABC-type multidrug transport system fused ATPase/permease subunit
MKNIKNLFNFLTVVRSRKYKKAFALLLFFVLLIQSISLVSPYILGLIVDNAIEGLDLRYVVMLVVAGLSLSLISRLFILIKDRIDIKVINYNLMKELRNESVEVMLKLSVGQHNNKNSGAQDKIISKGISSIGSVLQTFLYQVFPLALKTIVTIIFLFFIDWHFGVILFIGFVLIFLIQTKLVSKFTPKLKAIEKLEQETHTSFWQVLRNVYLFKSFGRESFGKNFVEDAIDKEYSYSQPVWLSFITKLILCYSLIPFFVALVMIIAAWKIGQGALTPGQFVIITTWSGIFFSNIGEIQWIQRRLSQTIPAIREYKEFIQTETDLYESPNPVHIEDMKGHVELSNVSFFYSDSKEQKDVLQDVSFSVQSGEFVGIVGKSGSGKSTLAKLLMRLYDPQKGSVLIDGCNVKDLERTSFLDKIGYVGQEAHLFDWTIRDNIIFGLEHVSDDDIEDAMQKSGLGEFLQELKDDRDGLNTMIGENGIKLSGGQKQRLTIARALLKKPAILILDEATASLDTETEKEIQCQIDKLTRENKTTTKIVIAHRLSTVVHADSILVFDNGLLVDKGTHEQLLDRCERYQDLVKHQDLQHVNVA